MFSWGAFSHATSVRSLYVIGSGASHPEIGRASEISELLRDAIWRNGIFPATPQATTQLKERLLAPHSAIQRTDCTIPQVELDRLTPPELIEALLPRFLTLNHPDISGRYKIFDRFWPSVVFNFNQDNLSDCLNAKHLQLHPHGKIIPALAHSELLNEAIRWLAISPQVGDRFKYWRPVPEHQGITSEKPYSQIKTIFPTVRYLVIIGYSFGSWGGSRDDAESFEMFMDLLRWKPTHVLVIDPSPLPLIELIKESAKLRSVDSLMCRWNILVDFLMGKRWRVPSRLKSRSLEPLTTSYLRFEDVSLAQCST